MNTGHGKQLIVYGTMHNAYSIGYQTVLKCVSLQSIFLKHFIGYIHVKSDVYFPCIYIGIANYGCDTLHHGKYTGCTGMCARKIAYMYMYMSRVSE